MINGQMISADAIIRKEGTIVDFTEIICILLTQAILWFGGTGILIGLFIINYATGKVKFFGVGLLFSGIISIGFILLTQLPAKAPIIDIGVQYVSVLEYTLAVFGMIFGVAIGVMLFLLLLMRK